MQIFDVIICPIEREHKLTLVVIRILNFFVFVLAFFNLIIRHIHIVLSIRLLSILWNINIITKLNDLCILLLELITRPQIKLGELAWCIFKLDSKEVIISKRRNTQIVLFIVGYCVGFYGVHSRFDFHLISVHYILA